MEKILRSTPVGKIYVLVKADDPDAAKDRLAKEVCFILHPYYLVLRRIFYI